MKKSAANRIDWILLVSLLLLLCFGVVYTIILGYSSYRTTDDNRIKFGFVGPLTGSGAIYGIPQKKGIELAVEEINNSGGVKGRKIEVIYEDSQMDPNKSISAMKKLVDINRVLAVIGETSTTATLAIADIANRTKTLLISPLASGAKITDAGDFVFRISPSDNYQATVISKFAYQRGLRSGAIIYTNDDWGGGLQRAFQKDFIALGGHILTSEGVTPGTQDFRTQLVKIKEMTPDFLFIPLHPNESAIVLRQIKELEVKGQIIGGDNFSERAILKTAGNAADNVIFAMAAQPSGETFSRFAKSFEVKFKEAPSYSAAAGYDSVFLLVEAIKKGGPTGEQMRNHLLGVRNFQGASGLIGFDQNGDVTTKKFELIQIKNGQYFPFQEL